MQRIYLRKVYKLAYIEYTKSNTKNKAKIKFKNNKDIFSVIDENILNTAIAFQYDKVKSEIERADISVQEFKNSQLTTNKQETR